MFQDVDSNLLMVGSSVEAGTPAYLIVVVVVKLDWIMTRLR